MIRVFTAFSGYDSQCLALDLIGAEYELVGWSADGDYWYVRDLPASRFGDFYA